MNNAFEVPSAPATSIPVRQDLETRQVGFDTEGSTPSDSVATPSSNFPRLLMRSSMRNNNTRQVGSNFSLAARQNSIQETFSLRNSSSSHPSGPQAQVASPWICSKCDKVFRSAVRGNHTKHLESCKGKCTRCKEKGIPCEKIGSQKCKACKDAGVVIKDCDNSSNMEKTNHRRG